MAEPKIKEKKMWSERQKMLGRILEVIIACLVFVFMFAIPWIYGWVKIITRFW